MDTYALPCNTRLEDALMDEQLFFLIWAYAGLGVCLLAMLVMVIVHEFNTTPRRQSRYLSKRYSKRR